MSQSSKRARSRAARAAREEALRRRRIARIVAVGLVLALVVGFALLSSGGENGTPDERADRPDQPEPTEQDVGIACDGEAPSEADPQQYQQPPEMGLKKGVDYRAVISTSCGDIEMDLLEKEAPITVNSFVFLARDGYFDGLTWHRISSNFVIQSGDPNGQNGVEPDGPGYTIKDEFPKKANEYVFGTVAMANTGASNSGGSQFFIVTHEPIGKPAGLQPLFSIFGAVAKPSFDVVEQIANLETKGGNDPVQAEQPVVPAYINSIEIIEA
jgi:cyclophilin family peptidyl-prolyl cis-trans isomerase